ncbi:DNA polymerase-3 subunit delta [Constrictibacter sp. MBR-5]|jgi:DNA polymerase-3 subunit delta|uniref:DNA polymerase III subunit delta n=1 Tax=Constrictibacter sp. MBR-5 TaxID=3156467 RepID=UPI0033971ADB
MKIQPARADAFVARPDPAIRAVLLFGPDDGLVRERAAALARTVVADLRDPFRVAETTGAALRADPAWLADEAASIAFGGGRRVVRIRGVGDGETTAFERFLDDPMGDALVVAEASDLPARSALRKLFEDAKIAAAIACYVEEGDQLEGFIARTLSAAKVRIEQDALEVLAARLGGDRIMTRNEVEKLALYVGAGGTATVADVEASVGDAADLSLQDVAFATGSGDMDRLLQSLDRAYAAGESPIRILRAASEHFRRLHVTAARIAKGMALPQAAGMLKPKVFWKQTNEFQAQAKRWPEPWLAAALDRLAQAEIDCKTTGYPDRAICARVLMEVGRAAARR